MVFQNYALWPHMTVFENVAFGLRVRGKSSAEIKEAVFNALEMVHLTDCADRKAPSLSGGQQQRVALARALAVDPPLLLLDEPLSNLDARLRDAMREEISNICRKRGFTALYVTHDRQEALSMADRMAVMKDGKIRQLGTPRELYEKPCDRFCAEFLGDVNYIDGELDNYGRFTALCSSWDLSGSAAGKNGKYTAAVRPERIRFAADGKLDGEILYGSYFGDNCLWCCRVGGRELMVCEHAPEERRAGDRVRLDISPENILLMQ